MKIRMVNGTLLYCEGLRFENRCPRADGFLALIDAGHLFFLAVSL